jgi:hypothetical protein
MIKFYLSGPMRGLPEHNYPQFHEVEEALAKWLTEDEYQGTVQEVGGFEILNPARNFDGDQTRTTSEYMNADLGMVLGSDVLVLLPGWEKSEGADRETKLAEWAGKRFILAERESGPDIGTRWSFRNLHGRPAKHLSPRADALFEAQALITGDRNNAYGPPTQDFQRAADAANAYGYRAIGGREIQAHDIAILVMLVKLSRLTWTPGKRDSWVDIAGYAGCGFECAVEEAGNV